MNSPNLSPTRRSRRAFRRQRLAPRRIILAGSILSLFGLAVAHGATSLTWDPTLTGTASGGGSGIWNAGPAADWFNGTGDVVWPNDGSVAIFGGPAGTVGVSGTVNVGSITFNTSGYALQTAGSGSINLSTAGTGAIGLVFPAITVSVGNTEAINAVLAGSQGFHEIGGGLLTLGGANTLTGGIVLDTTSTLQTTAAGVLNANLITFSSTTAGANGDLQLGGFSQTIGGLSGTTGIVENASATAATLTLAGTTANSFSGTIQNGTGAGALSLAVTAGTQTLGGTNTYTGGTTLSGGQLNLARAAALGTGALTLNGGTLDNTSGASITLPNNNPVTIGGSFTFGGTSALNLGTGALTLASSGTLTLNGSGLLTSGGAVALGANTLTVAGTGAVTFTGIVSGSAATGLAVTGGTVTLTNTGNLFTGNITVDGSGVLAFPGSGGTAGDPLALGPGAKTITLTNGGAVSPTTSSNPTSTLTKAFVIGAGGGRFNVPTGVTFSLDDANQFSGSGDLTVTGTGTGVVALNTQIYSGFTGNAFVNSGTLRIGTTFNLGNTAGKTVTVGSGGVFDILGTGSGGAVNVPQNIVLNGTGISSAGALISSGTTVGVSTSAAATLTLATNASIGGTNTTGLTVNGVISGPGILTKVGAGTLLLTNGGNTYSNGTILSAGNLSIANGLTGSATGTGPVTLNGGTLISPAGANGAITGTIGGLVSGSATTAHIIAPGGVGTIGGLSLAGGLTTTSRTTLSFDLTGPGLTTGDLLSIGGTFTIGAATPVTFNFNPSAAGNYRLISYSGPAPTLANLALPTPLSARSTYAVSSAVDPGFLDLVVSASGNVTSTYSLAGGGTYNATASWNPATIPNVAGDAAIFGASIAGASATVTLDSQPHVAAVTFNNPGTGVYTVSAGTGGVLYLDNGATVASVTNSTNNNIVSAPVVLASPTTVSVAAGTNLSLTGIVSGPNSLTVTPDSGGTLTLGGVNTFVGPVNLTGGTLSIAADTGLGNAANPVNFTNNAVLFGSAAITSARVFNLGAGGGTFSATGAGTANKILLSGTGALTGSGPLTKLGTADLQLAGANAGFSGDVALSAGEIEINAGNSVGTVGTITISGGDLVGNVTVAPVAAIANPIVLNSGTISSFNTAAGGALFTGPLTVPATGSFTISPRQFTTVTTGETVELAGNITGAATIALSSTQTSNGTVILAGDNTNWTGSTLPALVANQTIVFAGLKSRPNGLSGAAIPLNAGTYGIAVDGDGSGVPAVAGVFTDLFSFTPAAANNLSVGRAALGLPVGSQLYLQAANKTIQESSAQTLAGNTLTLANNNGYGLDFTSTVSVDGATISVATASLSTAVPGLTIDGVLSSPNVTPGATLLTKAGAGTLLLTNAANATNSTATLGGAPGQVLSVTGGVLAVTSDAALGLPTNQITLNGAGATFEAFDNISTARTINLSDPTNTNNNIGVASGKTLTLTSALTGVNGFQKSDAGLLLLPVASGGLGPVSVVGGIVRVSNSTALGTTNTITVTNSGSALQLDGSGGSLSLANPLSLNSIGVNSNGAVENFAGNNTESGAITLAGGSNIGASAGTLTLTGGITGAQTLTFSGAGNVTLTTGALGAVTSVTKIGGGTTTLGVNSTAFVGALAVNGGTFTVGSGGLGSIGGAGAITVTSGALLKADDSSAAITNRLSGTSRPLTLNNGTLEYVVNGTGSSETFGALVSGAGADLYQIDTGTGTSTLNFTTFNNGSGSGSIFSAKADGTGALFGSAANTVKFSGAISNVTGNVIRNAVVLDAAGVNFAANNTTGSAAVLTNGLQAYTFYNAGGAYTDINSLTLAAADTIKLGPGFITGTVLSAPVRTVNALDIAGSGITLNGSGTLPGSTLTLSSGQVLVSGGTNTLGSGLQIATAAVETSVSVATGAELDVAGVFSNNSGVAFDKSLGGTLKFNTPQYFNVGNGATTLNGGLTILNGGTNTLFPGVQGGTTGANLIIGAGATLDLNGNSQTLGSLKTATIPFLVASGTIQNSGAPVTLAIGNNGDNWGGQIVGAITVAYGRGAGNNTVNYWNDNTYTGNTILMGPTVLLKDTGKLSGTNQIDLNYSALTLDNTGTIDTSRLKSAVTLNLRGGTFNYLGRAQTASVQNVGTVNLTQGNSVIASSLGGVGTNSADLIIGNLVRHTGDGTVNFSSATAGLIGNSGRIQLTQLNGGSPSAALTNNILGGWAIVNTSDFASYLPGLGVGALGSVGFPGYSPNILSAAAQPADNIKVGYLGLSTIAAPTTINSVKFDNVVIGGVTFTNPGDTLTLASGGFLNFTSTAWNFGSTPNNGNLTTTGPEFFFYTQGGGTPTINSAITGAGVTLVKSGANAGTLAGTNTYGGGTVVNLGTLTLAATGTLPAGGLTVNIGTFAQVAGGSIAPSTVVTVNGSGTVTLANQANTLDSLVFNNVGGTPNPTVNATGTLTLSNAIPIVASSGNPFQTPTIATGFLDFGNAARTFTINPVTVNGVSNIAPLTASLNITSVIQNSGLITKGGNGNLQLSAQNTFAGGMRVPSGGLIFGAGSTSVGGVLTSGPVGTGTLTLGSGATLLGDAARTIGNALVVQGDLNFAGVNNLTFTGGVTLPATGFTLNVAAPQMTVSFTGGIAGATGSFTKTGLGPLSMGAISGVLNLPGGGPFSILTDGNSLTTPYPAGTGALENIADGGFAAPGGDVTLTIGRNATTFAPLFTTALNKTIQFTTKFDTGGNTFTLTNNNGYGLEVLATATAGAGPGIPLVANQTYNVATASASNVVQGLTIDPVISGAFGIVKLGAGSLVLANSANTFGGAGKTIDILGGIVQVSSDGALGDPGNSVILDVNAATGVGLRAAGTFGTSRTVILNQAANAIEVTAGKTLTLNSPLGVPTAGNALAKNDNGTLLFNANNPTWAGTITVNAGAIAASNPALTTPFGTGTITIPTVIGVSGAAVQLSGGVTITNPLSIAATASTGIGNNGVLESVSGINTYAGPITQVAGNSTTFGADPGATLNVTGAWSSGNSITFTGGGNINIQTAVPAIGTGLNQLSAGTTTLSVNSPAFTAAINVNVGTLKITGSGVALGGTGTLTVQEPSGTFIDDDSQGTPSAHLGVRQVTLIGGNFTYNGNAANSAETFGALVTARGATNVVTSNPSGSGTNALTFASLFVSGTTFGVAGDASLDFEGAGLGTAANKIVFTAAPPMTASVIQRATVGGTDFATYAGGTIAPFSAYNVSNNIDTAAATDTLSVTANPTFTASKTINALRFNNDGITVGAGLGQGATLTLTAGGILNPLGSNSLNVPIVAFGAQGFVAVNAGTLTINSLLTGTAGFVKALGGSLIINAPANSAGVANISGQTLTGNFEVNSGSLQLVGPVGSSNVLTPNQFLILGANGTLDLNGTSQFALGTRGDGAAFQGNAGVFTNTNAAPAALIFGADSGTVSFGGNITQAAGAGAMGFLRASGQTYNFYSPLTYTGPTVFLGGINTLLDGATLASTSSIDVDNSQFNLNDNGNFATPSRVNPAATITMRGGSLTYANGRAQTASAQAVGDVVLSEGNNLIQATTGGTGVNSAVLTLNSLTRPAGSSATVRFSANQSGSIGSVARVVITTPPTLTNNIIGAWAIDDREWASYVPGLGISQLNSAGSAGYDGTVLPATSQPAQNIRIASNQTLTTNLTINTLNVTTGSFTVDLGGKTLTLAGGGLLFGQAADTTTDVVQNGTLTSGPVNVGGDLYIWAASFTGNNRVSNLNAVIADNGAGSVRLIKASNQNSSATNTDILNLNAVNTYSGGTVVNGGTLAVGATGVIPAGGILVSGGANGGSILTQLSGGVINPANIITVDGNSTVNFFGNNTIAGLVLNGTSPTSATVNSFQAGTLAGTLTIGAGGVTATPLAPVGVPTLSGRFDFGSSANTIKVAAYSFDGFTDFAPTTAGLVVQGLIGSSGGITKSGAGVLQLSTQAVFTGPLNVTGGALQLGNTNAGSRFSDLTLGASTRLNLNGVSTTVGSLSGTGTVMNSSNTAGTLTVGFSGASTTFSGQFLRFNDALATNVALTKIGAGTLTLNTAQSLINGSTGVLNVNGGGVTYSGLGTSNFASEAVAPTGTLTLDDSGTATPGRLAAASTLTLLGGTVAQLGNPTTPSSQTLTGLTFSSGGSTISLVSGAGGATTLTFTGALSNQNGQATGLITGSGLGGTGAGSVNVVVNGTYAAVGGGGAAGTNTMSIRPDLLGDATGGTGTGFIFRDAGNILRPLNQATELYQAAFTAAPATGNVGLSSAVTLPVAQTINSLTTLTAGSINPNYAASAGIYAPTAAPLALTVTSGGILAFANTTIGTALASGGTTQDYHVVGAGTTLTLNGSITSETSGIVKADAGTLIFNAPQYFTGSAASNGLTVNAGNVRLNGGNNTLEVVTTFGAPTLLSLYAHGGQLDLNGNNQLFDRLSNSNALPGTGGIVTNLASGAAANLVTAQNAATTFAGLIQGNLNFSKFGANALTLTSPNSYSGTTLVGGSTLTLRDSATLSGTRAITVTNGTLQIDQSGLNPLGNLNPTRIAASVPITLQGGALQLVPGGSSDASATFNTVTAALGHNTFNVTVPASTAGTAASTDVLNIGNLIVSSPDVTVNFVGGGNAGNFLNTAPGLNNGEIYLNAINGQAVTVTNKILGGWAIVGSGEFATYVTAATPGAAGINYGVVTMNGVTSIPQTQYDGTTVPTGSNPTQNIRISGTGVQTIGAGGSTINVLAVRAALTNLNFTGATDVLNLVAGGLSLTNGGTTVSVVGTGNITAGGTQSTGTAPLYVYASGTTNNTVNAAIIDNAAGAKVRAVLVPISSALVLNGINTYTGGTVINGTGGTISLSGATPSAAQISAGQAEIPKNGLTINSAVVTMVTNPGQIDPTNDVVINGSGGLTLVGANTLSSITLNGIGGTTAPTVTPGGALTLTSATPLGGGNDNAAFTPVLANSGSLILSNANPTINVTSSALTPMGLLISTQITSAGGTIVKTGAGLLGLNSTTSNWTTGLNLQGGVLDLGGGNSTPSTVGSTVTSGPLGTGTLTIGDGTTLVSDNAARTLANTVSVANNASFTFGGTLATHNLILNGAFGLGTGAHTITVTNPLVTATLGGAITGGSGLTKAGAGVLAISNAANSYGGATSVTGGVLQATNATAIPVGSAVSVSAGAALDLKNITVSLSSLSGAGLVTDSGSATALTIGGDGSDQAFSGLIAAATPANLTLFKAGTGKQTLSGNVEAFTGLTTINAGALSFGPGGGLTGPLTVNSNGTLATASTAAVPLGNLVLGTGGTTSVPATALAATAFTTGTLTTFGNDRINVTGALPAPGTYTLIDYTGTALTTAQFANLTLGSVPSGFLGVLRNNTANTSVDLLVEAAGTANTYTGGGGGVLAAGDTANFSSPLVDGQQLLFNDTAANTTAITGTTLSPQLITFNNSTKNYALANNLGGNLTGGIVKNGIGTAQLTGVNSGAGPILVNAGTLRVSANSTGTINTPPTSALGSGVVTLNGGTLQIDPVASTANAGLFTRTFTGQATGQADAVNFTNTATSTATNFAAAPFTFAATSGTLSTTALQFLGKINLATAGQYAFFSNTDDGARLFVDGVLVVENEGGKGAIEAGGTINLSAGLHDFRVDYVNNSGAGTENVLIQGPGLAKQALPASLLSQPETTSSGATSSNLLNLGNLLTVSANSTLNLNGTAFTGVQFGGLTSAAGTTLTVQGNAGKLLRAGATTVAGTVTYNTTPDLALGAVVDGGIASTIVKQGSGRLILDNTAAAPGQSSLLSTTTIDVQAGKLVLVGISGGTDPAGAAKLQLNGGGLLLDTKFNAPTFDNAVNVVQSSLLEVQAEGLTTVLGSAANGVTLGSGTTLTVDTFGGSRGTLPGGAVTSTGGNLQVNGVISGATGNLTLQSNQSALNEMYPVYATLTLTAANTFGGATTVNGGFTSNIVPLTVTLSGAGTLAGTSGITLNNGRLILDNSGTNVADRIPNATPVTLNNSILSFVGSTTAASTETLGTVTGNSGFNQVLVSNVFATGTTALTLGLSRGANNSQFSFYGANLGSAATNADVIKFAAAPALTGGTGAAGSTTIGILPYAVGAASGTTPQYGLVTYDVNGIRPLSTATEYTTLLNSTSTSDNVRDVLTAATANVTGKTVNAYVLDNTFTAASAATLTGTLTPASGALVLAGTVATGATAPGAVTLTGGTVDFGTAEGIVTVTDTAGAVISSILANTGGTAGLTFGGYGSLTLSGANTFTGTITVNGTAGTGGGGTVYATGALPNTALILGSATNSVLGNANNPIVLNGGAIRFGVAGLSIASTHPITLGTAGGTFDTTGGSVTIASIVSGPGGLNKIGANILTLNGTGNAYTGPTAIYAGTLVTTTGPQGNVTLSNGTTFQIDQTFDGSYGGVISGIGSFVKSSAGNLTLTNSSNFVGTTTVSGGTSLSTGALLASVDNALPIGGQMVVGTGTSIGNYDLSAANQTLSSLTFSANASALASTVTIGSGRTLTLTGSDGTTASVNANSTNNVLRIGGLITATGTAAAFATNTQAVITGAGTLAITSPNANVALDSTVTGASPTSAAIASLDLSGLANFNATVATLAVGQGQQSVGTLRLAANNSLTATNLIVGNGNGQLNGPQQNALPVASTLALGNSNLFNVANVSVSTQKDNAMLGFAAGLTGTPTLVLRGATGGTSAANLTIGFQNVGTAANISGSVILTSSAGGTDGSIDALLNNLLIGEGASTGSTGQATGVLEYDQGTVTVNTTTLGVSLAGNTGTTASAGTINLKGGSFTTTGLTTLGVKGSATQPANGTINISGGTATFGADIVTGTAANTSVGTATVALTGGTLDLGGHNLGLAGQLINTFTLAAGTLKNLGQFNAGADLSKTTGGILTIAGTNTYTGATNVTAGTVVVIGSLTGSTPSVSAGATLQLGDGTAGHDGTVAGIASITDGGSVIFNRSGTSASGVTITGGGTVAVTGPGTQILTGVSNYSGATTIDAGATLQLGDGTTDGNLTGTSGIADNGQLIFNRTGTLAVATPISGGGSLVVNGAGTLALTGTNSFTGGSTINGGVVQINSVASLGNTSGAATINNATVQVTTGFTTTRKFTLGNAASAIAVDAGQTFTINGTVGGSGALNATGAGILALGGASTPALGANIKSGTLAVLPSGSLSGNLNITNNATFDVSTLSGGYTLASGNTLATSGSTGTATVSGSLNAAGTVAPGGAGALGSLTVTGSLSLSGTLQAELAAPGSGDLITTSSLTLQSGALLSLAFLNGYRPNGDGSLFTLINNTGASPIGGAGVFANATPMSIGGQTLNVLTASDGELFAVSYSGEGGAFSVANGNDVVLMAVPEPSAVGSLMVGLASLAGLRRFRRRAGSRAAALH